MTPDQWAVFLGTLALIALACVVLRIRHRERGK
jgi:hypothetical protein